MTRILSHAQTNYFLESPIIAIITPIIVVIKLMGSDIASTRELTINPDANESRKNRVCFFIKLPPGVLFAYNYSIKLR